MSIERLVEFKNEAIDYNETIRSSRRDWHIQEQPKAKKEFFIRHDSGDDALRFYLEDITKKPLLSAKEEKELVTLMVSGRNFGDDKEKKLESMKFSSPESEDAYNELVKRNLRLVVACAKKYTPSGVPYLDLIQEGNIGLMKGLSRFDPKKSERLCPYVTEWIDNKIRRAIPEQTGYAKIPDYLFNQMCQVCNVENKFLTKFNRKATVEEISKESGFSEKKIKLINSLKQKPLSLEYLKYHEDSEEERVIQIISSQNIAYEAEEKLLTENVEENLQILKPREKEILELRFGLNRKKVLTFKQLGKKYGITWQRARQVEIGALDKMKNYYIALNKTILENYSISLKDLPSNVNYVIIPDINSRKRKYRIIREGENIKLQLIKVEE